MSVYVAISRNESQRQTEITQIQKIKRQGNVKGKAYTGRTPRTQRKTKAKFTMKGMKGIKVFSIAIGIAIAIGPSHSDFWILASGFCL